MTRKQITDQIRDKLTAAGYPPRRFICEVQTGGSECALRQGDEWDGGLASLSYAYRYAKPGDTVMIAVSSRGRDGELEDVVEFTIQSA